ncbi:SPOR domain-containing protein [Sneathiella glossodoripedis]|uniref:SPOR domain-containing protein n=1 Tax=Sneathiella glossodoripedis TaxID=418853 RepID=UPI000471D40D|nr:SPOR domain-containing protein [Sneathiella glossodoripedis]
MLQFETIHKANKAMLLIGTSLVVASCGTAQNGPYSSTPQGTEIATETNGDTDFSGELSPNRLIRIAEREWSKGKAETALRFYSMAAEKAPQDPTPVLGIAKILRKSKKTKAALDLYNQLASKYPDLPAVHSGIGYTLLSIDKPYLAAKSFEHAVSLDKKNAKSLGGLALALDSAGEHEKAQDYYRLAIEAEPANLTYQNNLALSLALTGRLEQAIAMFDIITAHPNATARHRQNLALVYGMAGKSADAMRYSRMDLSESEARNNALYFQALNSDRGRHENASSVAAVAPETTRNRGAHTSRQPYTLIETKTETKDIRVQPDAEPDVPSDLIASARMANRSRSMIAEPAPKEPMRSSELAVALSTNSAPEKNVSQPFEELTKLATAMSAARAPAYKSAMQYAAEPLDAITKVSTHTEADQNGEIRDQAIAQDPENNADTARVENKPEQVEPPLALLEPDNDQQNSHKAYIQPIAYDWYSGGSTDLWSRKPVQTAPGDTKPLYYVQVASFQNLDRAKRAWRELTSRHPDLLNEYSPVYTVAEVENRGTYYRVRIGGFAAKETPRVLCGNLQERSTDCYLTKVNSQIEIDGEAIADADPANDQEGYVVANTAGHKQQKRSLSIDDQTTASVSY